MRQTYKIALSFMALATMALTGCQQQREMAPEEVAQAGSVAAQFSTPAITRVVSGTQWEGTEMIGISNTTKQDAKTTNVAYKANQRGATTNFIDQGNKLMLPGDNSEVAFAAYYPYASSVQSNLASYTITKGSDQPVLFATQSGTAQNPKLPFTFKHKLAQVKVVLTVEEGLNLADLKSVVFKGGVTDVKMNILTGDLTTRTTKGDVTLKNEGNGTFSSYVVPQTFTDYSFAITLGDKSYTLKKEKVAQAPGEFKEGNSYTFKAKLTKDGKVVNPDGSKIDDMNDGGSSDGGDLTPDKPGTDEPTPDEPGTDEPAVDAKALPITVDFENATSISDGFTTHSVVGDQEWKIDGSTYKNGAQMSGHIGGREGSNHANEDWLFTPAMDFSSVTSPVLLLNHNVNYTDQPGTNEKVFISENYVSGDPSSATWTPLEVTYSEGRGWTYVDSKTDLKAYAGKKNIHIAFKYTSTDQAASTWSIRKIEVKDNEGGSTVTPEPQPEPDPTPEPQPEPTPTTGNLLFPGGDFEDFAAFTAKISTKYGLQSYANQSEDPEQGTVLQIKGTPRGNDYVFTMENVAVAVQNPTKITFKVKGTAPGKSFSINVYANDGTTYARYNVGPLTGDKTVNSVSSNQYTGKVDTQGKWVTVTLNVSGVEVNTSGSGSLFALKVGKETAWDVMVDDFKIE